LQQRKLLGCPAEFDRLAILGPIGGFISEWFHHDVLANLSFWELMSSMCQRWIILIFSLHSLLNRRRGYGWRVPNLVIHSDYVSFSLAAVGGGVLAGCRLWNGREPSAGGGSR
jgi:hypothetical protein